MIAMEYQGTFSDSRGTEPIVFTFDGRTLRTQIRGILFEGIDFDSLVPDETTMAESLGEFTFSIGRDLCGCTLTIEFPVPVMVHEALVHGRLQARLLLGLPLPGRGLDSEDLALVLTYGQEIVKSPGTAGLFELEMLQIQNQLPVGVYMKACINCLYSDYSPYGQPLWGGMMCYRNLKAEYLRVKSKCDLWSVHGRQEEFVPETYLCPEFERRIPGTGYRG